MTNERLTGLTLYLFLHSYSFYKHSYTFKYFIITFIRKKGSFKSVLVFIFGHLFLSIFEKGEKSLVKIFFVTITYFYRLVNKNNIFVLLR